MIVFEWERHKEVIPLRGLVRDQGPGALLRAAAATAVGLPTSAALTIEGKCALLQEEGKLLEKVVCEGIFFLFLF